MAYRIKYLYIVDLVNAIKLIIERLIMNSNHIQEVAELMDLQASLGGILGRINSIAYRWSMVPPEPATVVDLPVYQQPVFQMQPSAEPSGFTVESDSPPHVLDPEPVAPAAIEYVDQPLPVSVQPVPEVAPVNTVPEFSQAVAEAAPVSAEGQGVPAESAPVSVPVLSAETPVVPTVQPPVTPVRPVLSVKPAAITVDAPVRKAPQVTLSPGVPVRPTPIRPVAKPVSDYNARLNRILNS